MDKEQIKLPTTKARRRLDAAIMADYAQFISFDVFGHDAKDIRIILWFAKKQGISREQIYRDIFHAGMVDYAAKDEKLRKHKTVDEYANGLPEDVKKHGGFVFD